jgi:hypothetical protein
MGLENDLPDSPLGKPGSQKGWPLSSAFVSPCALFETWVLGRRAVAEAAATDDWSELDAGAVSVAVISATSHRNAPTRSTARAAGVRLALDSSKLHNQAALEPRHDTAHGGPLGVPDSGCLEALSRQWTARTAYWRGLFGQTGSKVVSRQVPTSPGLRSPGSLVGSPRDPTKSVNSPSSAHVG